MSTNNTTAANQPPAGAATTGTLALAPPKPGGTISFVLPPSIETGPVPELGAPTLAILELIQGSGATTKEPPGPTCHLESIFKHTRKLNAHEISQVTDALYAAAGSNGTRVFEALIGITEAYKANPVKHYQVFLLQV